MHKLDGIDKASLRDDIPSFRAGDTLRVHVKVIEGSRSRVQVFQGVVIRRHGGGIGETFTVRKVSFGVGVERTFPLHTPIIDKIEVVTRGDVRRAKLYYLRDLRGKAAKIKEKRDTGDRGGAKGPGSGKPGSGRGRAAQAGGDQAGGDQAGGGQAGGGQAGGGQAGGGQAGRDGAPQDAVAVATGTTTVAGAAESGVPQHAQGGARRDAPARSTAAE